MIRFTYRSVAAAILALGFQSGCSDIGWVDDKVETEKITYEIQCSISQEFDKRGILAIYKFGDFYTIDIALRNCKTNNEFDFQEGRFQVIINEDLILDEMNTNLSESLIFKGNNLSHFPDIKTIDAVFKFSGSIDLHFSREFEMLVADRIEIESLTPISVDDYLVEVGYFQEAVAR